MTKNIWIDAALHLLVKIAAARQNITMGKWLEDAARQRLEREAMPSRGMPGGKQ